MCKLWLWPWVFVKFSARLNVELEVSICQRALYRKQRLFLISFFSWSWKCASSQKTKETKFTEKPTTAHTPEDGRYLCYCVLRLTYGCRAVLCQRDPEITRHEDTEGYMSLTGRALQKMRVHNPKHRHICPDIGPGACSVLDSPHINLRTLWSQCSDCEDWDEYGASCSRFWPIICGWVNWHRNTCKRAASK